ncbi:Sensor histidine kinase VraS [Staphylococcus aureus]|uniref:Sensor histidine kinase VraS n=1 Tax=Staphylococcus aureus TaxID=1280 RepID=A0A2X2JZ68_STAAU|nr:Sensor histidine kinase VraS [Staphylococcus aureus]
MRLKTQNLTNENYNINDVKVKKIIEDERQRLARELHDSVSQQLFAASMMLSAIKETKLEPPLEPTNSDFRENGSRFAARNACFAVTFKTAWFKRQIFR